MSEKIGETEEKTVVGAACDYANAQYTQEAMRAAAACGVGPTGPCPKYMIGAPVTTLTVTTTVTVTITLNMKQGGGFQVTRLVIPQEYSDSFRIGKVLCGARDITLTDDPLPGDSFSSSNQFPATLPFIPMESGAANVIKVEVYNEDATMTVVPFSLEGIVL